MRVLVVEDEKNLAYLIKEGLTDEGYIVDVAGDGEEGLYLAKNIPYDIIILDLMLPKIDGLEVLRTLRQDNIKTPILLLTARDSTEDKVIGLDSGADDYLTKPFSFDELIARMRAITRRYHGQTENTIRIADLKIDLDTHQVKRDEKNIELSSKEYALLELLALNKNRLLTRDQILEHIYDYQYDFDSNVIDVLIARLRKKIDKGFKKRLIHTIRGAGYMLKEDND
ncbi:response regulator transcription factor [Hippea sp. KM1]|uniref:response regulator transcription factor n=1 Tax=Hippea sp. KM1 TaxID=944481 RepID=UPI00046D34E0|nr:response regulator transcription factor [Hippea sp. KM1]